MASTAVLNIRLPEELKQHGNQVLDRNGVSISQIVRDLYSYMEKEQELPEFAKSNSASDKFKERRDVLKNLKGSIDIPYDFNLKDMRDERIMDKYGQRG